MKIELNWTTFIGNGATDMDGNPVTFRACSSVELDNVHAIVYNYEDQELNLFATADKESAGLSKNFMSLSTRSTNVTIKLKG
jgi:hypothetical protein